MGTGRHSHPLFAARKHAPAPSSYVNSRRCPPVISTAWDDERNCSEHLPPLRCLRCHFKIILGQLIPKKNIWIWFHLVSSGRWLAIWKRFFEIRVHLWSEAPLLSGSSESVGVVSRLCISSGKKRETQAIVLVTNLGVVSTHAFPWRCHND